MLKLRAKDIEDVQVVSAVLQDSIVPSVDMAYQPEASSFILVAQRLRREDREGGECERICCAVTIKGVSAAHTMGMDLRQQDRMYDLLALMLDETNGVASLTLVFAGDARVRLDLTSWGLTVEDFGEAWPTLCHPRHDGSV